MKIDTERVIFEVHFRPLLWDKQHDLYKNRDARAAAWLEVCKEVVPNFENYNNDEQKDIDKKIQQRWRTARDMYKKEKISGNQSSGSGAKKKKKYEYFEILTFLDRVIDTATDDSLPEADNTATPSSPMTALPSPTSSGPLTPLPSTSASANQQSIPVSAPPKQKKKKGTSDFEKSLLELLRSNQLELESEDIAFFQSLQPTLKKFTNYQKMMFRTRVMQVIMEMEMDMQNINYSMSGSSSANISQSTPSPYNMGSSIPDNTGVLERGTVSYGTISYESGPTDDAAILKGNTTTSTDTSVVKCYTSASAYNMAGSCSPYYIERSIPSNTLFENDMTVPAYNTTSYESGSIDNAAILESNTPESTDTANDNNRTPDDKTAESETH